METLYKWILGFMLVAIFLEKCSSKPCKDDNNKCNTTLLPPNAVCSQASWTATCNDKETSFTCGKDNDNNTWIWIPSSVDCSSSASSATTTTTTTTTTTKNNNTTTTNSQITTTTNNKTNATNNITITTTKNIDNTSSATTTTTTSVAIITTNDSTTSIGKHTDIVLYQKHSNGNVALYVSVPVVIVVLVIVLILIFIWRRKHRNTNTKQNGFAFHNESYHRHHGTNSNDAPILMSDRSSTAEDNHYSVIPADTVNPVSVNDESTYNTIDLPEGVRDKYCHVTTKTTVPNDNTYSHTPDSSALPITDNVYSHIGNGTTGSTLLQKMPKPTDGSADTYNTLQTLPNNRVGLHTKPRKTDIENGDIDAEYNHLANTLKHPAETEEEENADTYSHICQSAKPNREYAKQGKKTNVLNQQSKADLKNNGYESASGASSPYLEFKVEDQTDETKQFKILEIPTNETNNYEEAHTHQYFVLEKEDRMAV